MIEGAGNIFRFSAVEFDPVLLTAILRYECGQHTFVETVQFSTNHAVANMESEALDHALKLLHLTAGVSYYKAFATTVDQMEVAYPIPVEVAEYLNHIYEEGLGEFFFMNNLEPKLRAKFVGSGASTATQDVSVSGFAVGLGGGKDSLVAVALLKKLGVSPIATYGINAPELLTTQSNILSTDHAQISRSVDTTSLRSLKTTDGSDVLNGHIPISAILGSIGLVHALLRGLSQVVVAVERSADEPTRTGYYDKSINHQYSKSSDFEKAFDKIIKSWVSSEMGFFSILRPLRELDIMRLFYALDLDQSMNGKYTSCNKSIAFTSGNQSTRLWCGDCDKCAFIFLLMTGAGRYDDAMHTFGEDLIGKPSLQHTYKALLGLTDSKPFDCVGEIDESRESMDVAKERSEGARGFDYSPPGKSEIWRATHNLPDDIEDNLRTIVMELLH